MAFLQYMGLAFVQVLILFILVGVGFACDKAGIFTQEVSRKANDLLFYIITPAVIVDKFLKMDRSAENLRSLLSAVLIAAVFHIVAMVVVIPLFRKSGDDRPIFQFASMYGNVGFLGLPLAEAVAGDEGVFYCSVVVAVFNVFVFTHGIVLMRRGEGKFQWYKLLVNPGMIGILIALPFFLLKIPMPEIVGKPIGYLGSMNTPFAMVMFGTYLANTPLAGMLRRRENYLVAALKLILFPLAGIFALYACGVRGALLTTFAVLFGAPTANVTVMFAAKYNRNTGTASTTSGLLSLLSILTLPTLIALAQFLNTK